jgi:hypothetical protein
MDETIFLNIAGLLIGICLFIKSYVTLLPLAYSSLICVEIAAIRLPSVLPMVLIDLRIISAIKFWISSLSPYLTCAYPKSKPLRASLVKSLKAE